MIFNAQNFEASYAEEISSSYSSSESDLHDSNYAQSNEAQENKERTQEILYFSNEVEIDSDQI